MEAWTAYRTRLTAEAPPRWSEPTAPAFVGVDRHGNVTGGMVPDCVTRATKRISARAGVPLAWTGHSLRIGLATTARRKGGRRGDRRPGRMGPALPLHERLLPARRRMGGQRHGGPHVVVPACTASACS